MKLQYALALTLSCSLTVATAQQQTVSGTVLDKIANEPIPYASVYLASMKNGMYSFENGSFKLNYDTPDDTIIISAIGYKTFKDRVTNLKTNGNLLYLEQSVFALDEVVVTPGRKAIKRMLGKFDRNTNCTVCTFIGGWDTVHSFGREFIHFINGTDKSVKINRVFVKCQKKDKHLEAIFMLRFYAKEGENRLPGELINKKPIVRSFTKTTSGALVFDIEDEEISLPPEGLFVSFEHIGYKPAANTAELIRANFQFEKGKEFICELYYLCTRAKDENYSLWKGYYDGKYHYMTISPEKWKLSVKLEITEMR